MATSKNARRVGKAAQARKVAAKLWADPTFVKARRKSGLLAVAAVALYISYWHIRWVALEAGMAPDHAAILAVSIDGLLIVSAKYVQSAATRFARCLASFGFVLAMTATLAGNWLAAEATPMSRAWHVWPAVALISTAVIIHVGDRKPSKPTMVLRDAAEAKAVRAFLTAHRKAAQPAKVPARQNGHASVQQLAPVQL